MQVTTRIIDGCKHPPFPLQVRIRYGDRTVLDKEYSINQWGGASIELKVSRP